MTKDEAVQKDNKLNFLFAIFMRLSFALLSFALSIILSRLLGLNDFGTLTWILSITLLVVGLSQAGSVSYIVRETAQNRSQSSAQKILRRSFSIYLPLSVVVLGFFLFIYFERLGSFTIPITLLVTASLSLVLVSASVRGMGKINKGQFPELLSRPFILFILIALLTSYCAKITVMQILWLQVFSYALSLALSLYFYFSEKNKLSKLNGDFFSGNWLNENAKLMLIGWLSSFNSHINYIILGSLASFSEVGLFKVAAQFALLVALARTSIDTVMAPEFSKSFKKRNFNNQQRLLSQSCSFATLCALSVFLLLLLFGKPVIIMTFGADYIASYEPLLIMSLFQLLSSITGSVSGFMISGKKEKEIILSWIFATLVMLTLALFMIPTYGAVGAALSAGAGLTVKNYTNALQCWKCFKMVPMPLAYHFHRNEK